MTLVTLVPHFLFAMTYFHFNESDPCLVIQVTSLNLSGPLLKTHCDPFITTIPLEVRAACLLLLVPFLVHISPSPRHLH